MSLKDKIIYRLKILYNYRQLIVCEHYNKTCWVFYQKNLFLADNRSYTAINFLKLYLLHNFGIMPRKGVCNVGSGF